MRLRQRLCQRLCQRLGFIQDFILLHCWRFRACGHYLCRLHPCAHYCVGRGMVLRTLSVPGSMVGLFFFFRLCFFSRLRQECPRFCTPFIQDFVLARPRTTLICDGCYYGCDGIACFCSSCEPFRHSGVAIVSWKSFLRVRAGADQSP